MAGIFGALPEWRLRAAWLSGRAPPSGERPPLGRPLQLAQARVVGLAAVAALAVEGEPGAVVLGLRLQPLELVAVGARRSVRRAAASGGSSWNCARRPGDDPRPRRRPPRAPRDRAHRRPRWPSGSRSFSARHAASPRSGSSVCWLIWLLTMPPVIGPTADAGASTPVGATLRERPAPRSYSPRWPLRKGGTLGGDRGSAWRTDPSTRSEAKEPGHDPEAAREHRGDRRGRTRRRRRPGLRARRSPRRLRGGAARRADLDSARRNRAAARRAAQPLRGVAHVRRRGRRRDLAPAAVPRGRARATSGAWSTRRSARPRGSGSCGGPGATRCRTSRR